MNKQTHVCRSRLSAGGKIAALIGLALCTAPAWAQGGGIQAASSATKVSQTQNQVDVVNIATPNAQGLSHNQYNSFNVGKQGAVLNNAQKAGKSQLAGNLAANPHLANQAASVILNEVIEKNPSLLAGQQEVFGMAADYVLANPAGITCDGCGFINTPRASLVVGAPEVGNDHLLRFQVGADGGGEVLTVRNNISGAAVLDLIAPRLDINGNIRADENIHLLMGKRTVDYGENIHTDLPIESMIAKAKNTKEKAEEVVLDGQIFGSMHAKRIRIHNSDPRAKTDIQAHLHADNSINATVNGTLNIAQSDINADEVRLTADVVNAKSSVVVEHKAQNPTVENVGFLHQRTHSNKTQQEALKKTNFKGKDIIFNAKNAVVLEAVNIEADRTIDIAAHDVQINSIKTNQTKVNSVKDSKLSWFNETVNSEKVHEVHGSNLHAGKSVKIAAKGQVLANVVDVQAASVAIDGAKGVHIDGAQSRKESSKVNRYQNETAKLKTGEHTQSTTEETWVASNIKGGAVAFSSNQNIHLDGVNVKGSQAVKIEAQGDVVVGAGSTASGNRDVEHYTYWGGIGGGNTQGKESSQKQQYGSSVRGATVTIDGEQGVELIASKVQAERTVALKSAQGEVAVRNGFNQQESLHNKRHGTAFNITDKSHKEGTETLTALSSEVRGKNVLLEGEAARLVGSNVKADQHLDINSKNIYTDATSNQTQKQTQDYTLGFHGYAKKEGAVTDFKGKAGVRLQGVTTTKETQEGQAVANTLTAENIHINGGEKGEVHLKGSKVLGSELKISAGKISNDVALVQTSGSKEVKEVSGGGIYVSGSMEKIAIGLEAGTDQVHHTKTHKTAVSTDFDIAGNINIQGDTVRNVGTQVKAGGVVDVRGDVVENVEAHHVQVDKLVNGRGGVDLSIYAKPSPTVGAALVFSGEGDGEEVTTSTAVTSAIQGQNIVVDGKQSVTDRGTQYQSANDVVIKSVQYQGQAAEDTVASVGNVGQAQLGVKVYTGTFQDVTAELGANTTYKHIKKGSSKAVLGNIVAQDNVRIHADKLASAMNIKAGKDVQLKGKEVAITQANNRKSVLQGGFNLGGSVGATFVPAAGGMGVTPSFAANGGMNYLKIEDTQAVQANVQGQNVLLQGQKAARVEGANIQAANTFRMDGDVSQFDAAYDSHQATGVQMNGNMALSLSMNGEGISGGSAGIGGALSVIDEKNTTAHGGSVTAQDVKIYANSADLPLLVSAARIQADDVVLQNKAGDVAILAGESKIHKANWGFGGNLGAGGNAESGITSFDIGGHLDVETENSRHYQKGNIDAKRVNIISGQNTVLQGDMNTGSLNINADKEVHVLSAQDKTGIFDLSLGANIGGSPAQINAETTVEDVVGVLKDDFENGTLFGMKVGGKIKVNANDSKKTQKSNIQTNELNVVSGSKKVLVNASDIQATSGKGFGDAQVQKTENTDYVHDLGFFVSVETPNFKEMISNAIDGKEVESPFKADGHLNWEKAHQIKSEVKIK